MTSKRRGLNRPVSRKRIKSMVSAIITDLVAFITALTAAGITAWVLIPVAYEWRGYVAYGGEWIAIIFVAAFTFYAVSSAIENAKKHKKGGK